MEIQRKGIENFTEELERRIDKSVELFKEGFNCSQSVVASFADLYGFNQEQALSMAASFGAGIGRMRQTCGAACGLFLLIGLDCGTCTGSNREGKSYNYKMVQKMAEKFKESNGCLICSELLGLKKDSKINPQAEARTDAYYKKRPCPNIIRNAASLFAEYLKEYHPELFRIYRLEA